MPTDDHYIHGTAAEEQSRLGRLNEIINRRCLEELRLRPGDRVIDIGSGLGALTAMFADAVHPGGVALGVERSEEQLAKARVHADGRGNLEFRQGSAFELPLASEEVGSFDVAFIRFVLEHVRDPAAVVRQAVRAVKPGGRVVLADDHHEYLVLHPACPAFDHVWRAYMASYHRIGCDPSIGTRLVQLLHEAGARPVRTNFLYFGACVNEALFPALVENMIGCVASARDLMVRERLASGEETDRAFADARAWARRPDAALWYPFCWAEGVRG